MLSDERIVQSLTDAVGSVLVMGNCIRGEVESAIRAALAEAAQVPAGKRQKIDRQWDEYPMGTIAHSSTGATWKKTVSGWRAQTGGGCAFPTPGADACAVTLPVDPAAQVPVMGEAVAWQFFQDGQWHTGSEYNNHRANTEATGIPTRNLVPMTATSITQAELDAKDARIRELEALLSEAYGYTTAASGLLPERIKAAIAKEQS